MERFKTKTICFVVHTTILNTYGGIETQVYYLSEELVSRGWGVTIVAPKMEVGKAMKLAMSIELSTITFESTIIIAKHARNINPINLQTLFIIVQIYVTLKDRDKASKIVNEILEYYPENLKAITGKERTTQQLKKINKLYFI